MTRRPEEFYIDYSHSFAKGLYLAGLGYSPGSTLYYDSSAYGNYGNIYSNLPKDAWKFDSELNRYCIEQTADDHHIALKSSFSSYGSNIYSISLWVCQVAAGTGTYYLFDSESGRFLLALGGGSGIGTENNINYFDGSWRGFGLGVARPAQSIWTAITLTRSAGSTSLYVNGIYRGTSAGTARSFGGLTNIGGRYAGTTWYGLIGKYSDFLIHNRVLSLPEIQQFADKSNTMLSGMIKPAKRPTIILFGNPSALTHTSYFDTLEIIRDCYWLHSSGTNYITDGVFGGEHGLSTYSNGLYKSIQPSSFKYIQFHGPGTSGSLGIETSPYYCRLKSTNIDPDRFTIQMWAASDNLTGCTANFGINSVDIASLGPFKGLSFASGDFLLTSSQKQRILDGRINDNYDYCEIKFYTQDPIISGMKFYDINISCSGTSTWNNYETGLPGTDIKYFYPNRLGFRGGSIWYDQNNNICTEISYSGIDIDPTTAGSDTEYITHTNTPVSGELWGQLMPSGGLSLYFDIANGPSGTLDSLTQVTRAQMNLRMSLPPSGLYENARDTFEVNGYNYRFKEQDYKEDIPDAIGSIGPKQRSLGYYIYGAGDVIEQSGFKTYNVELNFLDPSLSGNLSSIKYRNIDIFNNMEFQLVGLPSGVQLSAAELLLECIPNDFVPFYTLGNVYRSATIIYPDTSGAINIFAGNGKWHHQGNIDEGDVFTAFYKFAESSGTRTYPVVSDGYTSSLMYGEYKDINTGLVEEPTRYEYYRNPISIAGVFDSPTYYRNMIYNGGISSNNINVHFDQRIGLSSNNTLYFMLYRNPEISTFGTFFTMGLEDGISYSIRGRIYSNIVIFDIKSATLGDFTIDTPIDEFSEEPILVWLTTEYNSSTNITTCHLYTHSYINNYFSQNWEHDTITFNGHVQQYFNTKYVLGTFSSSSIPYNIGIIEFGYNNADAIDLNYLTSTSSVQENYDISSDLDKKFFASRLCNAAYLQGSGVNWIVPNGSGSTDFYTKYYIDDWTDLNQKHSIYNPVTTAGTNHLVAPSAIYVELVTEHSTDHPSGVYVDVDIEFDSGSSDNWKLARFNFNIPSGTETTYIKTIDTHIGMNGESILLSDVDSIVAKVKTQYVNSDQNYNGNLSIKSLRVYFDSYCVAATGLNSLDLYTYGGAATNTGTVDLFIDGNLSTTNNLDLYIYGLPHSASGDIVPLYTNADHYSLTAQKDLFINGLTPGYSSGNVPLYTWATEPGVGGLYYSTSLYMHGLGRDQWIPLYIRAPIGQLNTNIPLYLESHYDNTNNSLDLFTFSTSDDSHYVLLDNGDGLLLEDGSILLMGGYSVGSGISYLYIRGLGTTDGAYPANNNIPLFIDRDSESIDARLNLYMAQHEVINNLDTVIYGHNVVQSLPKYNDSIIFDKMGNYNGISRYGLLSFPIISGSLTSTLLPSTNNGLSYNAIGGAYNIFTDDVPAIETNDRTMMCWFKTPSAGSPVVPVIIGSLGVGTIGAGAFYFRFDRQTLKLSTYFTTTPEVVVSSDISTLRDDQWHHIAGVMDRDQNLSLYVDGVKSPYESNISPSSTINMTGNSNFYMSHALANTAFSGYICDVRVYNEALSGNNILSIKNGETIRTKPILNWFFNDPNPVNLYIGGSGIWPNSNIKLYTHGY